MTIEEFEKAYIAYSETTGQRPERAFFNVLKRERPDLAALIQGGPIDPWISKNIPAALNYIRKYW